MADEIPALVGEVQSEWVPRAMDLSDDPVAQRLSDLAKQCFTLERNGQGDDGAVHDSSSPA